MKLRKYIKTLLFFDQKPFKNSSQSLKSYLIILLQYLQKCQYIQETAYT